MRAGSGGDLFNRGIARLKVGGELAVPFHHTGGAKVHQSQGAVVHPHDVVRADIPVNDPLPVEPDDTVHQPVDFGQQLLGRQALPLSDYFIEGHSFQVFHHQIGVSGICHDAEGKGCEYMEVEDATDQTDPERAVTELRHPSPAADRTGYQASQHPEAEANDDPTQQNYDNFHLNLPPVSDCLGAAAFVGYNITQLRVFPSKRFLLFLDIREIHAAAVVKAGTDQLLTRIRFRLARILPHWLPRTRMILKPCGLMR